jgi:alanine-glyoxylate transaminase/serine-glyoxylate transaminase/serine-pyruvate transaminase
MNAVERPAGVDEEAVRKTLLGEFGLEIGAGLGPLKGKIWRFGLMGYSPPDNVIQPVGAGLGAHGHGLRGRVGKPKPRPNGLRHTARRRRAARA